MSRTTPRRSKRTESRGTWNTARRHWPILVALVLALASGGWFAVQRLATTDVEMVVKAATVSFVPATDLRLQRLQSSSVVLSGVTALELPAGALRRSDGSTLVEAPVPLGVDCETGLEIARMQLESLTAPADARVTFDTDEADPTAVQIASASGMGGALALPEDARARPVRLVGQDCRVNGQPFGEASFEPRAFLSGALRFTLQGRRSSVWLSLVGVSLAKPVALLDSVEVRQLDFTRNTDRIVSTIDTADVDGSSIRSTRIRRPTGTGPSDYLTVAPEDLFTIRALALNDGLNLAAHGRVSALAAGPAAEQRDLRVGFVEWMFERSLLASALVSAVAVELLVQLLVPVLKRSFGATR